MELDSSKVQVIVPPLSDADEELHDRETVGVVLVPPVIVKFESLSSYCLALVFD